MKRISLTLLAFLLVMSSACTGWNRTAGQNPSATATATLSGTVVNAELQLLLGTFTIEGTELAVTADQAEVLLPLWQSLQALSPAQAAGVPDQAGITPESPTPAAEMEAQIEALVRQIQAVMTPDQLDAISRVQVSQQTILAVIQARGVHFHGSWPTHTPQPGTGGETAQETAVTDSSQASQATSPASGPSSSGTGGAGSDDDDDNHGAVFPIGGSPAAQLDFVTSRLIDALIHLLEDKAGGAAGSADSSAGSTPIGTPVQDNLSESTLSSVAALPTETPVPPTLESTPTAASILGVVPYSAPVSTLYRLLGGTDRQTGRTYTAFMAGDSAVYVTNSGRLILTDSILSTTGNSSSSDDVDRYGLNAGVLADEGGTVSVSNSRVSSSGIGAYGIFSTGPGTSVNLANGLVATTGEHGWALVASQGGALVLAYGEVVTSSSNAVALAAGQHGTITLTDATVRTYGTGSAGIYAAGQVTVEGSTLSANGAEAAIIEGAGAIALTDSRLTSSEGGRWGVLIFGGTSGNNRGDLGLFRMTGGSLSYTAADGPLFFVTDGAGVIDLKGVELSAASGTLVRAAAGDWGSPGSNGGTVFLEANGQALSGDLVADNLSSITIKLTGGSSLLGAIDADATAQTAYLELDPSSTWTVTADSHLTCLTDPDGISGTQITNVVGNGHTVSYDRAACPALGGQTYDLAGGGSLAPAK
jgi:hypothetical protein